jgi:hypothetical protein
MERQKRRGHVNGLNFRQPGDAPDSGNRFKQDDEVPDSPVEPIKPEAKPDRGAEFDDEVLDERKKTLEGLRPEDIEEDEDTRELKPISLTEINMDPNDPDELYQPGAPIATYPLGRPGDDDEEEYSNYGDYDSDEFFDDVDDDLR